MGEPEFWNNKEAAQNTVGALKTLRASLDPVQQMIAALDDLQVLAELSEDDASAQQEFTTHAAALTQKLEAFEFQRMLSGPYDRGNAYLNIHAGAGGTESCDWTEMLLRMYTRWSERKGYQIEMVDVNPGEEAGLRSVSIHLIGPYAYGYLKAEIGVHRLVRISPFDANKRRHTSFASVDVTPELPDEEEIEIKEAEIKVETCRAGGAGGQHVNKTESVVRITHLPTGIVVRCQVDRSQHKNRRTAMKMLAAKLYALRQAQQTAQTSAAYDAKGEIAFGYQIRSYVLQPYQMVKDLRTDTETGNVDAVLDGEIDDFIQAYLRWQASTAKK